MAAVYDTILPGETTIKISTLDRSASLQWFLLFLILIAGAALRVAYNENTLIDNPIRADAAYNLVYANNLLEDYTFSKDMSENPEPDSYWAPGYPAFLAADIKLSQWLRVDTYNLIRFSQVLLGVATIYLCFLVANTFLPRFWALLPPLLVCFSPHLVSLGSYVLTETLFGFLLLLSLWALIRATMAKGRGRWLVAGVCFALAYLVNPVSFFLGPLLVLVTLPGMRPGETGQGRFKGTCAVLLLLAPLIITAGAWSVRSAVSVPETQQTASQRLLTNLTIGLYPDFHQKWRSSILEPEKKVVVPGAGVDASYQTYFQELCNRLTEDPLGMLGWYVVQKPILLWGWDIRTGYGEIYVYKVLYSLYQSSGPAMVSYSLMLTLHPWILVGSLLGLGYLLTERGDKAVVPRMIYVTLIYISLVYVVTQAEPRYSVPLRSELYLAFSYFLWRTGALFGRLRKQVRSG